MSLNADYQRDWPAYFDAVQGQPARDTLLRALSLLNVSCDTRPWMLDIACGEGRDSRAALAALSDLRILAIDMNMEGLQRFRTSLPGADANRVVLHAVPMEQLPAWHAASPNLPRTFSIINASFALPFCDPAHFPALWRWIRDHLAPGGIFAGQFFGDRDSWSVIRPASHHTRQQVGELLHGLHVEHLEEVEKDGSDAMGGTKHHHVFHVVARRGQACHECATESHSADTKHA